MASLRIDRDRPRAHGGRAWLLALIVVAIAIVVALWWWMRADAVEVRLATVLEETESVRPTAAGGAVLNASGYVTARRRATVSSQITGKVSEVLFDEGVVVQKGQVLARLDDAEQRAALALADGRISAAEQAMHETESLIALAEVTDRRARELYQAGAGSQANLDQAETELKNLRQRRRTQAVEVEVARRELRLRQVELDHTVIRSPFDGVVISKDAQPGEMVSPISAGGGFTRTGIGTVVDMSSLEIEVEVNESFISRVVPDQRVEAALDAYPDWAMPAYVITTIPAADRQKATVLVRIGFDELDPRILPDMGVKVAFLEADPGGAAPAEPFRPRLTVPAGAVRRDGDPPVVFVYDRGRVERRAVRLRGGRPGAARVEVESGLTAGERVVVDPPESLSDGDSVSPSERP